MKGAVVYLIVCSVLLNTFSSAMHFLSYEINFDFYKSVLCENQSKPELKCEGKCQLKKELQKDHENTRNPENKLSSDLKINLFIEEVIQIRLHSESIFIPPYSGFLAQLTTGYKSNIFHPPSLV